MGSKFHSFFKAGRATVPNFTRRFVKTFSGKFLRVNCHKNRPKLKEVEGVHLTISVFVQSWEGLRHFDIIKRIVPEKVNLDLVSRRGTMKSRFLREGDIRLTGF